MSLSSKIFDATAVDIAQQVESKQMVTSRCAASRDGGTGNPWFFPLKSE